MILFSRPQKSVYNTDNYAEQQQRIFSYIHVMVREKLLASRVELAKQHKNLIPLTFREGNNVIERRLESISKCSTKYVRSHYVLRRLHGDKYRFLNNKNEIVLSDHLKVT